MTFKLLIVDDEPIISRGLRLTIPWEAINVEVVDTAYDGEDAIEKIIAARNICPRIPIVWFSNDEGFGCQAYRLRADFFHAKPITVKTLEMALSRLPEKN